MKAPLSSSGRDVNPPDPSRPLDSIPDGFPIVCPACWGRERPLFEGASRPAMPAPPCGTCHGSKAIAVFRATSAALPGVKHVAQVGRPVQCLCGEVIPARHLLRPQGLDCLVCVSILRGALRRAGGL